MGKTLIILTFLISITLFSQEKYVLVVHGGAGYIKKNSLSPKKEKAYHDALKLALEKGYEEIKQGKSSLDAVQEAILILENSPLFNAGKGAVFTNDGKNELDASIMFGKTEEAGAVAGVSTIKNPIIAARSVMEKSPHVLLSRAGAEEFAKENGLEIVEPSYFFTQENYDRLQKIIQAEKEKTSVSTANPDWKFGTVGAVALDKNGNISAGTSTGGMMNKKWARIGDSPIIGAGTYANQEVGISSTGWGEFYIKSVAAYDVAAQIKYAQTPISQAVTNTLNHIKELGGNGGIIALNKNGEIAMQFNTPGMFRGAITENGKILIEFYGIE